MVGEFKTASKSWIQYIIAMVNGNAVTNPTTILVKIALGMIRAGLWHSSAICMAESTPANIKQGVTVFDVRDEGFGRIVANFMTDLNR